jgi:predicted Fe-S protein YdhL (DUF1289 family)
MAQNDPQSPCNRHCTVDPYTDICMGCFRTVEEIVGWTKYSKKEKEEVLTKTTERRLASEKNRR